MRASIQPQSDVASECPACCKDAAGHPAAKTEPSASAEPFSRLPWSWSRWLKRNRTSEGSDNLPAGSGAGIIPTSSTGSTSRAGAGSAQQLQPAATARSDDVDGLIDINSSCISRCASTISPQQQHATPCGSPPDTPSSSTGSLPLRRRTTSSNVLAACTARAHQLRQASAAVLRAAQRPEQGGVRNRLPRLPAARGSNGTKNASLPPLTLNSKPRPQQHQPRAASLFEAKENREKIKFLLGPHALFGDVTRYSRLLLAERTHEAHLQTVLQQTSVEQVEWTGTPAWEEDFSVIGK